MDRLRAWFQTYSDELLYKVQWPTVPELQSSTITVLVASLLIAFVIFIMDLSSSKVMEILYGIFN